MPATLDDVVADLKVVISSTKGVQQAVIDSQTAMIQAMHRTSQNIINASGGGGGGSGTGNVLQGVVQPAAAQQANTGYSQPPGGGSAFGGGGGGPSGGGGGGGYSPQPGYNQPNPGGQPTPGGSNPAQPGPGIFGRLKQAFGGQGSTGAASGAGALVRQAYQAYVAENENAARYQGMEGGTNRLHGLNERRREIGYAWAEHIRHPNGLTVEEAKQAFSDVTSFGYRDDSGAAGQAGMSRHSLLDFMQRNKTNMGMSGDESTQVLAAMTQNAYTNLNQLSDALHQVSNAAGDASVNAGQVREQFVRMFQTWSSSGAGAGAVGLAANQASSLARYGRDMQTVDSSAQAGNQFQYMAASSVGMTIGGYQALQRRDPGAARGILDRFTTQSLSNLIPPDQQAWIKKRAQEPPYNGKVAGNSDLLGALAEEWFQTFKDRMPASLEDMAGIISQTTGETMQAGQVPKWIVGHVLGMNASAEKAVSTTGSQGVVVGAGGKVTSATTGSAVEGGYLAPTGSGNTGQDSTAGGKSLGKSQQAYYDLVHKKGVPSNYHEGVIEKLLSQVKDPDSTHVIVKTEGGTRKLVTLAEAIKYFPNEIARGDIVFADGKYKDAKGKDKDLKGAGFSDVTGMAGDSSRSAAGEYARHVDVGKDITDDPAYKALLDPDAAAGDKADKEAAAKTMIELSPEAKKLLRLVPPDSGTSSDAADGTAPSSHNIMSDQWRRFTAGFS